MLKYLAIFGMLSSILSIDYVNINSIEYYQQKEDIKKIVFDFESDYFSTHIIDVKLDFYDMNDNYIKGYNSQLSLIGDKEAIANINYSYDRHSYALIDIEYNGNILVNDAKINFYIQEDCFIDIENRECKRIYKSYYKDKISRDDILNFRVNESNFNKYLSNNSLRLDNFIIYSNYSLKDYNTYLYLYDRVEGYDLIYDDKYVFLISIDEGNKLKLMDSYFVNLLDFEFLESYKEGLIKVNDIYFPYSKDYYEYDISLLIEGFVNIKIDFNVFTKGDLLGDCSTSKYCLIYEND